MNADNAIGVMGSSARNGALLMSPVNRRQRTSRRTGAVMAFYIFMVLFVVTLFAGFAATAVWCASRETFVPVFIYPRPRSR
jgi:hypothetical protein